MGKIDERTLQMMKFYTEHWQEPECKPPAVAKKFRLSVTTVRNHLPEIAEAIGGGITREDLLERVHSEHVFSEREYEPVKPVDLTGYKQNFEMAEKAMDDAYSSMEKTIAELVDAAVDLEEENCNETEHTEG